MSCRERESELPDLSRTTYLTVRPVRGIRFVKLEARRSSTTSAISYAVFCLKKKNHGLDFAGTHEACSHVVADDRRGNAVGHQLPRGEPCALQEWPRFVR